MRFTIFTGCYNSTGVIERLFTSLRSQTFKDFEWIIIDDNSTDETVDMVREFLNNNSWLNATLIVHKENTGIAVSRLEALNIAKGELFVKWDHDDINMPDQLEVFNTMWGKYKNEYLGTIWCLCEDENGSLVGNEFPSDEYISSYFKLYSSHIYPVNGETKERHNCISVEAHKQAVTFLCEHGLIDKPENLDATALWASLSFLGYNFLFINRVLRQYFIEPQRMSMSKSSRHHNPEKVFRDRKNWINYYMDYLPKKDFFVKQRIFLSLNVYGILSGKSLREILSEIYLFTRKFNVLVYYVPAWILARSGKL